MGMCDFRKRKGILNRIEICDDFLAIYVREVSICGLEYKGCKEYPAIMGTEREEVERVKPLVGEILDMQ